MGGSGKSATGGFGVIGLGLWAKVITRGGRSGGQKFSSY